VESKGQVVKAMAVIQRPRDGALLVSEAANPSGELFHRPLGGHVEFGEYALDTLHREFQEEIGQALIGVELAGVLENIFLWAGATQHEIVFIFTASFADEAAYEIPEQTIRDAGTTTRVVWRPVDAASPPLYPVGVTDLVSAPANGQADRQISVPLIQDPGGERGDGGETEQVEQVRAAAAADVGAMAEMAQLRREQYARYQPIFWRPAVGALDKHRPYLASLVGNDKVITLVSEEAGQLTGFLIATLTGAPGVYDPGGPTCQIDDFVIVPAARWPTTGARLLRAGLAAASQRGAVQAVVVTGHLDQAKRDALRACGLELASEWWVTPQGLGQDLPNKGG
jgi:ADP-ribose pyrophosphatase YjhB (NUDIX family)